MLNHGIFRLPKIKAWIDENNPGDLLIPFSVALEERLAQDFNDPAAQEAELVRLGTQGALGKITTAGYASVNVRMRLSTVIAKEADMYTHCTAHPILHLWTHGSSSMDCPRRYQSPSSRRCHPVSFSYTASRRNFSANSYPFFPPSP